MNQVELHHTTFFVRDYELGSSVALGPCPEGYEPESAVFATTSKSVGKINGNGQVKVKDGIIIFKSRKIGNRRRDFRATVAVNFRRVS